MSDDESESETETYYDCQESFLFEEEQTKTNFLSDLLLRQDPLFQGSSITLLEAMCTLFICYLTSHMAKEHFQKILSLLHVLLPPNLLPNKVEPFLKAFASGYEGRIVYHEFCSNCWVPYEGEDLQCRWCKGWRYEGGEQDQSKKKLKDFFLELPIQKDIEDLFQGVLF